MSAAEQGLAMRIFLKPSLFYSKIAAAVFIPRSSSIPASKDLPYTLP